MMVQAEATGNASTEKSSFVSGSWYPISTAPMRANLIDVWQVLHEPNTKISEASGVRVCDVYWSADRGAFIGPRGHAIEHVYPDGSALVLTHWMPRPEGPNE